MAVLSSAARVLVLWETEPVRADVVAALVAAGYAPESLGPRDHPGWGRARVQPVAVIAEVGAALPDRLEKVVQVIQQRDVRRVPTLVLLEAGALPFPPADLRHDDFLVLPGAPGELAARVGLLVARAEEARGPEMLVAGNIRVDPVQYTVEVAGQRTDLTFKEFELLAFLMRNPGRVFTRDVLLDKVWGYDFAAGTRTVDVHVRRLRDKLHDDDQALIQTVRGVGYKLSLGPGNGAMT